MNNSHSIFYRSKRTIHTNVQVQNIKLPESSSENSLVPGKISGLFFQSWVARNLESLDTWNVFLKAITSIIRTYSVFGISRHGLTWSRISSLPSWVLSNGSMQTKTKVTKELGGNISWLSIPQAKHWDYTRQGQNQPFNQWKQNAKMTNWKTESRSGKFSEKILNYNKHVWWRYCHADPGNPRESSQSSHFSCLLGRGLFFSSWNICNCVLYTAVELGI